MNKKYLSIISKRLKTLFSEEAINKLGKAVRFSRRNRAITPYRLALAFMETLASSKVESIADLQRGFNALFGVNVQYKPFHNQLAKANFSEFMRRLFVTLLEQLANRALSFESDSPFSRFKHIILQDGTSFAVHPALQDTYPGRFRTISPAAVELHVSMDLLSESVEQVVLTPDCEAEAQFLPVPATLTNCLVMGDRGYFKKDYFAQLIENQAFFIMKGKSNITPLVTRVITAEGKDIKTWRDKPLKELKGKLRKNSSMDMDVQWHERGKLILCRLIVTWNPETQAYQYLVTNLPREEFAISDIIDGYRLRWQIELLFKEWKSYANLSAFNTTKDGIMEGLIWGSLCAATLKRFFAHMAQKLSKKAISTRKVTMCLRYYLTDIIKAIIHGRRKLNKILEAALTYLSFNAIRDSLRRDNESGRAKLGLNHDYSFA